MKNLIVTFLSMVAILFLVRTVITGKAEMDSFRKREAISKRTEHFR